MVDRGVLQAYARKIDGELCENILPFWMRHVVDRQRGGFYGQISNDLAVDEDAARGALLTSRILWTYAAAYRRYGDPAYREMAEWAYEDLIARFWDKEYSGLYWATDADGCPTNTRKQIYGQAFGIYGLAEYHLATGSETALEYAVALFGDIEAHSYDPRHGGYLEAFTRQWTLEEDLRLSEIDMNEAKSMNTHLHVMEAYTNLMRTWKSPELARKQRALLKVMMERIVDPVTHHTLLFFDERWHPKSDRVSFGHDIEASWLLVESAEVLGDQPLLHAAQALAVRMAEATLSEALDADGGLLYEADPSGVTDARKEWWPQAETMVGALNAYQLTSEPFFLEAALRSWGFIEEHLVDHAHGEWFRGVSRHGRMDRQEPKVSFWKGPYHNGRACMEAVARLGEMA
ncbi:MAG TPA: AGE family epimerase/isomerase [Anaerolineae bacterium]|nr:AGE family epimerase/isomerase [Anaerolineae bacterium]